MMELAKIIPDMYLNVVTNGPDIALAIAEKMRPAITLCGGVLNRKNLAVFGYSALEMLSKINIDVAFISASGYSEECGFTCGFEEQVKLRRLLIEKARSVIILMDSTKFGRMLPYTFAKMEDVNFLVTDQTPSGNAGTCPEKQCDDFIEGLYERQNKGQFPANGTGHQPAWQQNQLSFV